MTELQKERNELIIQKALLKKELVSQLKCPHCGNKSLDLLELISPGQYLCNICSKFSSLTLVSDKPEDPSDLSLEELHRKKISDGNTF